MVDAENDAPEGETEEDGNNKKAKPLGFILIAVVALIVGGGAAAAVYFLAPGGAPASGQAHADASHDGAEKPLAGDYKPARKTAKANKHGKKNASGPAEFDGGKIQFHGETAYYVLDPMVISIQPMGGARHLKISLIIETSSEEADALQSRTYHIEDVLNTYLRSVNSAEFEDPAAMSRLRAQIRRRIGAVAPGVAIEQILITEFVLT